MSAKRGLGRGLNALIKDEPEPTPEVKGEATETAPVSQIRTNPWQARRHFEEEALTELALSIKDRGVLQPLLVRKSDSGGYELIAGERRLRAARSAGLQEVPVIVMSVDDHDSMELSLIENIQRENLNVIEEAQAYRVLNDHFGLTQEQIAERVGKARASVANAIRLLDLPDPVRMHLIKGALSAGHAKLILSAKSPKEQILLADRVAREGMSVRELERVLKPAQKRNRKPRAEKQDIPTDHLKDISDKLHQHLGTRVHLSPCRTFANGKKGKGSITIDFYSNEELNRLLDILGVKFD